MFVELICMTSAILPGLPGAREAILNELTKRMQRIFPEAEVRVKPMMTLPAINTDASKHEKEPESAARCRRCLKRRICGSLKSDPARPGRGDHLFKSFLRDVAEPRAAVAIAAVADWQCNLRSPVGSCIRPAGEPYPIVPSSPSQRLR